MGPNCTSAATFSLLPPRGSGSTRLVPWAPGEAVTGGGPGALGWVAHDDYLSNIPFLPILYFLTELDPAFQFFFWGITSEDVMEVLSSEE